ncbi:unnamed protein product [Camellia sinensis]
MAAEASSSTPRYSYHVFLSFTEDTCKTFSDHLYTALVGTGLHTFRDDDHGDESDDAIKAIKESRNPSHVRKQTGSVGEAFSWHEAQFEVEIDERKRKHGTEKVERWRAALREVADLGGLVLQNQADGHDTPIAKTVYNRNFDRFEGSSLLANVRETSKQFNDDVDELDQVHAIFGMRHWFHPAICEEKDFAIKILDECDYYTTVGIQYLIRRCLVTIDRVDNKLMMHQLLRDMGREIICQESLEEPGKCSRVWRHRDAYNVLKEKNCFILDLNLIGCYENFPKNLVVLDMRNSSLSQLWKGTKMLRLLKILNLSRSHGLVNSPDFLQLPNLEKLVLKDCINVVGVHESIGELERLVFLNLRGCRNLTKLPREIVLLKSLEKLILSNCSRLEKLPPDLGKMESLKVLHADGINQLSSNTGAVKPWHEHAWSWVSKLGSRPESICFSLTSLPRSLVSLNLANCNISGDGIPGDLGTLSLLHTLNLSGNPICSLPGNLKGLTSLFTLTLDRCTRLKSLPELPMRLAGVSLTGCSSLEMVTNLPNLLQQLNLDILDCKKLVEVRGVFKLEPIGNIDSEMINNLSLTELDSMGMVEVELRNNLTNSIIKAPTLQGLHECGIYSIFLSGSEIPSWFDKKSRNSSMSFTVPSLPHLKFCGLNICVVYACATDVSQAEWSYEYIKVNNKTKGLKWAYRSTFRGTAYEHKDVIWLSDWKIADLLMECGDEMNIFVNMAELFEVKEFGIRILYDEKEQKGIQNNTGYPFNQNVIDLSAYQMKKGEYFLCNLDDIGRGPHYSRMSEPKWECLENTGEMESILLDM